MILEDDLSRFGREPNNMSDEESFGFEEGGNLIIEFHKPDGPIGYGHSALFFPCSLKLQPATVPVGNIYGAKD
jgi:hypothetical protein